MSSRNDRLTPLLIGGAIVILIALITAWFFKSFERTTLEIPVGASSEARRNPLLAAERFLARVGIPVESASGRRLLRELPASSDTLVVRGLGPMTKPRQQALEEWIESGGRLIVEATELWDDKDEADDFLSRFEIYLAKSSDGDEADPEQTQVLVDADGKTVELTIEPHPDWHLEGGDADAVRVEVRGETRLIQQDVGEGLLTVMSDTEMFTNDSIGEHDHALFLAHLADPDPDGKVWLLYDSSVPWLGALLWGAAPEALVSVGVLLLIWLWSIGARLGPLEVAPPRRRRDLIEHMDAAAGFLWRHRLASHLVEATRHRVIAAWERQRPELRHLDPEARIRGISETAGRPLDGVEDALAGQADSTGGFVRQAARLQSLWLASRPGSRGQRHRGAAKPHGEHGSR